MRVPHNQAEIGIYTFGRLTSNPPQAQYVVDVCGLRDPYSNRGFKHTYNDGRPGAVQQYVQEDPRVDAIIESIKMIAYMHLRSEAKDGKWLSFGLKDHHGVWIAPAVGELVADALDRAQYKVALFHHELTSR